MTVAAASLSAQVSVTSDAAFNSQYQWRGLTTTNRPVIQPDLIVAFPLARATVTAGAWGSVEGGRYNDSRRHISENGGERAGLAEYDLYLEAAMPAGKAKFTLGATTYSYPNTLGTTSASNTLEAYAKAAFDFPFSPSIAVWQDVQKVKGSYAELAVSHDVGRVTLAAVTGWNFGQSIGDGGVAGYFVARGFTHADVSASTSFALGAVTAVPSVHVIVANDANTCVTSPSHTAGTKVWLGTSLSWSRIFGKRNNNPAAAAAAAAAPTQTK
jgi:hypothetical protein